MRPLYYMVHHSVPKNGLREICRLLSFIRLFLCLVQNRIGIPRLKKTFDIPALFFCNSPWTSTTKSCNFFFFFAQHFQDDRLFGNRERSEEAAVFLLYCTCIVLFYVRKHLSMSIYAATLRKDLSSGKRIR